jgi:hypothetical protein
LGWFGLAQTRKRAALNIFRNKNAPAEFACVKTERKEFGRTEDWAINSVESLIWFRSKIIFYAWFKVKLPWDLIGFGFLVGEGESRYFKIIAEVDFFFKIGIEHRGMSRVG